MRTKGRAWFENVLLPRFTPISMAALLTTLVLIFAFQAENITTKTLHVAFIAVPILIQVYFNSSLTYGLMRLFKVEYAVAAPGALIGASNFFELAVATAIALFGPDSGAALATVVGVLIEVPVMLTVAALPVNSGTGQNARFRLAMVEGMLGNSAAALEQVRLGMELLPPEKDPVNGAKALGNAANTYAWLGRFDLALPVLARIRELKGTDIQTSVATLRLDPIWDPIREDPRFRTELALLAAKEQRLRVASR